jgi:hypothetical protein
MKRIVTLMVVGRREKRVSSQFCGDDESICRNKKERKKGAVRGVVKKKTWWG